MSDEIIEFKDTLENLYDRSRDFDLDNILSEVYYAMSDVEERALSIDEPISDMLHLRVRLDNHLDQVALLVEELNGWADDTLQSIEHSLETEEGAEQRETLKERREELKQKLQELEEELEEVEEELSDDF